MAAEFSFISTLSATLPLVVSPIVAWLVGRSGLPKQSAMIDYLNKRLDALERLNKLHTQVAEGPTRQLLDAEIEYFRMSLGHAPRMLGAQDAKVASATPSQLSRFFLTGPAASVPKRIFKSLFYFFFAVAVLMLPAALSQGPNKWAETLAVAVFYFGIALLFRRAAR